MKTCIARVSTAAAITVLSGCAAMDPGGSQTISLSINPETAQCDAYQHGERVGAYDLSQRSITVPRNLGSLDIVCSAAGYKDKRVNVVPDNSAAGRWGALLIDFGPVKGRYGYPASIQITMESADRPGQPV